MAKKLRLMSLFQELSARAQVTNRRPAQSSTGLYLMHLRSLTSATTLPRRRFAISVDLTQPNTVPHPVKITHVRVDGKAAPVAESPAVAARDQRRELPQVRPAAE